MGVPRVGGKFGVLDERSYFELSFFGVRYGSVLTLFLDKGGLIIFNCRELYDYHDYHSRYYLYQRHRLHHYWYIAAHSHCIHRDGRPFQLE